MRRLLHYRHLLLATTLLAPLSRVSASDHLDAPNLAEDRAADLGDLYAWPTDDGHLAVALTFAGGADGWVFDPTLHYGIHFMLADGGQVDTYVQFGESASGDVGIRISGLPGEDGPLVTLLGETVEGNHARAWADLADDPYFADLEGWQQTLASGTFAFDSSRDSLAGSNTMAVVIELETESLLGDGQTLRVWADSLR